MENTKTMLQLRESTQFPPNYRRDEYSTHKRTFLDSSGLTTNGIVQIVHCMSNEIQLQYLVVNKQHVHLDVDTSYDDSVVKLHECLELVK
jgi:hypothetical protein